MGMTTDASKKSTGAPIVTKALKIASGAAVATTNLWRFVKARIGRQQLSVALLPWQLPRGGSHGSCSANAVIHRNKRIMHPLKEANERDEQKHCKRQRRV